MSCLVRVHSDPPAPHTECPGGNATSIAVAADPTGHRIFLTGTPDGATIFVCMRYGALSEGVRINLLGEDCLNSPPSTHLASNLSRVRRGLHPNHKRGEAPIEELVPLAEFL